jgi:outer membrane protein assembly factor BamE
MLLACAALLLSACVYRLDTQQGNILDVEQVDQVEVGMTRSQVRFVLGTPMVADPFDQSRWDYVYWQRKGKGGEEWKSQITVWFDGDKVARLERAGQPRPPGAADTPREAPETAAPAGDVPVGEQTRPEDAAEPPSASAD